MYVNLLPSFHGLPTEDFLQFMKKYNVVLETFPIVVRDRVLTRAQLQMRCFQYCLKDRAKQWYMALRLGRSHHGPKSLGEELKDFIKATDEASIAIRNSQSANEQMLKNYIQWNDQMANSMDASIRRLETQLEDLGDFIIPVTIGESKNLGAVLDIGSSINMMPLKVYKQLKLQSMKPTQIELKMANNSLKTLCGVVEDVQLDIHGLKVLVNFVVLEVKDDESHEREWKLLLRRSFMATTGMEVNVVSKHFSFSCGGSEVEFYVDRLDERLLEGCFILDVPKSRKRGRKEDGRNIF
ncbi:hypothetical protein Dsin_005486 [Dipteronia sinensis]|uniref:Retrotransposon gag domain-containing protein n=1 Tax=Dipteronia sinensis TaxID=43782 RepID=A0AAE0EEZ1_9ROSI|nr:hypothetical protein Dsin_005486 [Dipteronia sinensis]